MTTGQDLAWFISWESLRVIAELIALEQAAMPLAGVVATNVLIAPIR